MTRLEAVYLFHDDGPGNPRGAMPEALSDVVPRSDTTMRLPTGGNWAHSLENRPAYKGDRGEHACEKKTHFSQQRSLREQRRLAGRNPVAAATSRHACTGYFSLPLSLRSRRSNVFDVKRQPCRDRQQAEAGLTAALRSWRN